jgi:hypothetical protein
MRKGNTFKFTKQQVEPSLTPNPLSWHWASPGPVHEIRSPPPSAVSAGQGDQAPPLESSLSSWTIIDARQLVFHQCKREHQGTLTVTGSFHQASHSQLGASFLCPIL